MVYLYFLMTKIQPVNSYTSCITDKNVNSWYTQVGYFNLFFLLTVPFLSFPQLVQLRTFLCSYNNITVIDICYYFTLLKNPLVL